MFFGTFNPVSVQEDPGKVSLLYSTDLLLLRISFVLIFETKRHLKKFKKKKKKKVWFRETVSKLTGLTVSLPAPQPTRQST